MSSADGEHRRPTWPSRAARGAHSGALVADAAPLRPTGRARLSRHRNALPAGPARTRWAIVEELGRLADVERAVARKVAVDDVLDAAGPRRHHHDARREEHRLGDRVGDEHHRLAGQIPQPQQLLVELVADDLVERAEGLVHQQQIADRRTARGRSRRAAACRPRAAREISRSKPVRLTRSRLRATRASRSALEKPMISSGSDDVARDGAPGIERRRLEHVAIGALQPRLAAG